jgi:hypothetical protein
MPQENDDAAAQTPAVSRCRRGQADAAEPCGRFEGAQRMGHARAFSGRPRPERPRLRTVSQRCKAALDNLVSDR